MYCSKCGNKLNESGICVNCNQKLNQDVYNNFNNEIEKNKIKKLKRSKVFAWISFILALVPILLILCCYISSAGSFDESGAGAIWWLAVLYYMTVGVPLAIISLICGIISLKNFYNKLAIISTDLALLPFIWFLIAIVASMIKLH